MQIKKDYKREQIETVAKRIFLRKGFAKASMRDIAQGAGIGVSNLYNYFRGKDKLFRHLVTPLITELEQMMSEHHNVKYHEQFLRYVRCESEEMVTGHMQAYIRLISRYRDELKLLMFQAQGSSIQNFIDEYTDECIRHVLAFMDDMQKRYPQLRMVRSRFTYHIHTVWMFSFISEIVKHDLKPKEIEKVIRDYIQFECAGWRSLINET